MRYEIPLPVLTALQTRYRIRDHVRNMDFDQDWSVLHEVMERAKAETFAANDRILVEHIETDYYFKHCSVGVNLRNFFLIARQHHISPGCFLFYTNHFGLDREIDQLLDPAHPQDRPTVIESFLTRLTYSNNMEPLAPDLDQIKHHALCTMVLKRSHRNALYNAICDIAPDRLKLAGTLLEDVDD